MDLKRWLRTQWDRVGAWVLIAVGLLFLLFGWNGASNTPYPAEQIPFILSGGVGGALLVGLGAALLISADLRDEWHKLDRIEQHLAAARDDDDVASDDETVTPEEAETNGAGRTKKRTAAKASRS